MDEILKFIDRYCDFLLRNDRYRIVESEESPSFGGNAYVVLASDALRLRFIRDRGQLFLDVQALQQTGERNWFSIDIVRRLITGERLDSAELDAAYAQFLRDQLDHIEALFTREVLSDTVEQLRRLEKQRSRELFG